MFFLIDFLSIDDIVKLAPGSTLLINRQSSKFKYIQPGVVIRLGETPPELVTLLPEHVSHLYITNQTPMETILSISEDKILIIDMELEARRLSVIKSHTVCMAKNLSQGTINRLVFNHSVQRILVSPDMHQNDRENLLTKFCLTLENYRNHYSTRNLTIIDCLKDEEEQEEVVYISKAKLLSDDSELEPCSEPASNKEDDQHTPNLCEDNGDFLMSATLTFVMNQFDNYKIDSQQMIAELRQQVSTLQHEMTQLKQRNNELRSPYVGQTYKHIKHKRGLDEGGSLKDGEKSALQKVLAGEARRKQLRTDKGTEGSSRSARELTHNSALRFLTHREQDSSPPTPSSPGNTIK